ncbi:MAG: TolC family protein [Myxococcales bacterium]
MGRAVTWAACLFAVLGALPRTGRAQQAPTPEPSGAPPVQAQARAPRAVPTGAEPTDEPPATAETTGEAGAGPSGPPAPAAVPIDQGAGFDFLPITTAARGGLTAEGVATRVVKTSPRSKKAAAERHRASRRADRAYSLFVPRIDLSARYTRLSEPEIPDMFRAVFPPILNNYSFRAAIRVPVSDYFLTLNEHYESAQQLEKVGELQKQGEDQALVYDALREYYELARAVASRTLSEHRVQQLKHFVDEIRVLVEGGELSTVELAQSQARLSSAEASAERDRASERIAEETLRQRLSLSHDTPIGVAEPLTTFMPEQPKDLQGLIAEGRANRPEARALIHLIAAHEHTSDAAAAARYPALSVFGDVNTDNPNQRYVPLREEFNTTWSLGVELTWSPTELAQRNNELDDAQLEVARARQDLMTLYGRIAVEVTGAYENARAAAASVEISQQAVDAAQEALDARMALFRAGEATSRQVLDAELDLRSAQLQWVDSVLSTHLAHAALVQATGRTQ